MFLAKVAQKKINNKFKSYTDDLKQNLNAAFSTRLTMIANEFLLHYTYDQLIPEA